MGSSAMADIRDDCGAICRPQCDSFSSDVCNTVTDIVPILKTLGFFFETCDVRVSILCRTLCFNICTLNTITPVASPAAAPPCKA
ncbi:hypothetical protein HU200_054050 [Digitaria exilis]|uniref:Uncharacterized protein n=1 Tax=Digitaria exilis TaxID=1010633 RepID=A0A835E2X6_9POAL|nr:hypothetical protein HU200_054050 [Digitaria exilis]